MTKLWVLDFQLPEKVFKNEALFLWRYGKCIRDNWCFYHKISDADPRTKPFDSFTMIQWFGIAIEAKKIDWYTCYPYQLLRGSSIKNPWWQVKWLTDWGNNWWVSLVIVYSKKAHKYKIFDFKDLTFNTKYIFDEK